MVNQQAIYLSAWRVSHEHIDQDKPKENLLRRLLLSVEEGKQEQPTTIAMLQTRSILRQRLRCTKSSKKGVVADLSHTKRQVAIWRIQPSKHSHIKVYRQTMKGVCRYIQRAFTGGKKKMPGEYNLHQASFRQS